MIIKNNIQVTKRELQDEINELQELIDNCDVLGLEGVIKTVNGTTEYWYKEDMQNWINENEELLQEEC